MLEDQRRNVERRHRRPGRRLTATSMRSESGPFPAILLVFLSLTLLVACYLMSQVPQPTDSSIETYSASDSGWCTSYLGTRFDCH
jgi:hypothetical protein